MCLHDESSSEKGLAHRNVAFPGLPLEAHNLQAATKTLALIYHSMKVPGHSPGDSGTASRRWVKRENCTAAFQAHLPERDVRGGKPMEYKSDLVSIDMNPIATVPGHLPADLSGFLQ